MSKDKQSINTRYESDGIDLKRRELGKSAAWMLLTASLGIPAASVLAAPEDNTSGEVSVPPWGSPSTLVSGIGAGTLAVVSVAETVEAYIKGFGYVESWSGTIPAEMAEFWGVPAMAGRAAAVVGPPGFQRGMIRIVELGKDFQTTDYRNTLGWFALEIQVRNPDTLVDKLNGLPFVHTGGPGSFIGRDGKPVYRAAQFTGPSGEALYMTQHMQLDQLISIGPNNVGPLFIQTLAATPYEPTRDFYMETLGMIKRMEIDVPRKDIAEPLGQPEDQLYKMAAVRAPEYCSIQIDEYPATTPHRPAAPGYFSSGVSMSTLMTYNLEAVKSALTAINVDFTEIASNSIAPFMGSRAIFCLGRAGERLEIVEVKKA
jgi:hypothetical protein